MGILGFWFVGYIAIGMIVFKILGGKFASDDQIVDGYFTFTLFFWPLLVFIRFFSYAQKVLKDFSSSLDSKQICKVCRKKCEISKCVPKFCQTYNRMPSSREKSSERDQVYDESSIEFIEDR